MLWTFQTSSMQMRRCWLAAIQAWCSNQARCRADRAPERGLPCNSLNNSSQLLGQALAQTNQHFSDTADPHDTPASECPDSPSWLNYGAKVLGAACCLACSHSRAAPAVPLSGLSLDLNLARRSASGMT